MIKKLSLITCLCFSGVILADNTPKTEKTATQKASKKILGKWEMDVDATLAVLEKQGGRTFSERAKKMIKSRIADTYTEFTATEMITYKGTVKKKTEAYKVLSDQETQLEIEIADDDDKSKTIKPVLKFKGKNLLLSLNGRTSMVLKR